MRCRFASVLVFTVPTLAGAQMVEIGRPVTGELTVRDATLPNGSHYRIYGLNGRAGTDIAIALTSDDFDATAILLDATGARIAADDDSGGRCNALITTTLPRSGDFQIVVNTNYPLEVGRFTLLVEETRRPAADPEPCSGFVPPTGVASPGAAITDTLGPPDASFADGTFFDVWVVPVPDAGVVTIDIRSDAFDPHLTLLTGRGQPIQQNDNGAGGCNARAIHVGSDGQVRALVRSHGGVGSYTVHVAEGAAAINHRPECGALPPEAGTVAGFNELDTSDRALRVDRDYLGSLTTADPQLEQDDTRVQAWMLRGDEGQEVTIDLQSDDFDPYLLVYGPGLPAALSNDDGAGGCNARITVTLPSTDPYRVIVNHAGARNTGEFEIRTRTDPDSVLDGPCLAAGPAAVIEDLPGLAALTPTGQLALNDERRGVLATTDVLHTTDTYVQAWSFAGTVGTTVTVTLRSDAFDAYLFVMGPGVQGALRDDDSAGGCDARVTITFPRNGTYRAIVTSSLEVQTGAFTLSLGSRPQPPTPSACLGDR